MAKIPNTHSETRATRQSREPGDTTPVWQSHTGSTVRPDLGIDTFIADERPHKQVFEEIDAQRATDGSILPSVPLNQKVIWISQLQRGGTGARSVAAIRDLVLSVGVSGNAAADEREMAEFVLKLEAGSDIYDVEKLLMHDIDSPEWRAEISGHIRARLPRVNLLHIGDTTTNDFQTALLQAATGSQPERVTSFIRLALDGGAQDIAKIKDDIARVKAHLENDPKADSTFFADFPTTDVLPEIGAWLIKKRIFVFREYSEATPLFAFAKGDAAWMVASDIGHTATEGARKQEELIPGFQDFILRVNQTNPYLPINEFDSFAYFLTARLQGQEQDNIDTLKRLGRTLAFDNISVRSQRMCDHLRGLGEGILRHPHQAQVKSEQIDALLDLWGGAPAAPTSAEIIIAPPVFEPVYDPSAAELALSQRSYNPDNAVEQQPSFNTKSPIRAYGDHYPVVINPDTTFAAKFEYDHALLGPGADPDMAYQYVQVRLQDADGNVYAKDGSQLLRYDASTGIYTIQSGSGSGLEFKRDDAGYYCTTAGRRLMRETVSEALYDQQGHRVATRAPNGILTRHYHDAEGQEMNSAPMRRINDHTWIGEDGIAITQLSDGNLFFGEENALLTSIPEATPMEIMHHDSADEDLIRSLLYHVLPKQSVARVKSDAEGVIQFRLALPDSVKNVSGLHFTYAVDGTRAVIGDTPLYVQYVEEAGHAFLPAVLVDLDFLETLKPEAREMWLGDLRAVMERGDCWFHYYTLRDDSRRTHFEELIKEWGFPQGPLFFQDRLGFDYKTLEARGRRAGIRHRETMISNGLIHGIPYLAMVTDSDLGAKAADWTGIAAITQPSDVRRVLVDERAALTARMETYHHIRHQTGHEATVAAELLSANRPYVHEVDAVTVIDGPSARQAKLDAYRGLGKGDVIFYEIFEYNFDELGNDIFSVLEECVLNGATLFFHYDDFGSRIYPILENEAGFSKLKKLAKNPGENGGQVFLINQPLFSDGGPNHVDHRKRSVIIRQKEWIAPDGSTRTVPVMLTEISGRNVQESYYRNPPLSREDNDYETVAENDARYDASAWIYGQGFARDNISDMFFTMDLNFRKSDKKPWERHDLDATERFAMIMSGGQELPEAARSGDYRLYCAAVARVIEEEYNVVGQMHPIIRPYDPASPVSALPANDPIWEDLNYERTGFNFTTKRNLAVYDWFRYRDATTFKDWALFDAAQSILIEEDFTFTASSQLITAVDSVGYQQIYDAELTRYEHMSQDEALLEIRERHYSAEIADDWRAQAQLEAGVAYENLITIAQAPPPDFAQLRGQYTAGYYDAQEKLAHLESKDPTRARYEAYHIIDAYGTSGSPEEIGRQKGAVDYIFKRDQAEFTDFLAHFDDADFRAVNSGNYWVKNFDSAMSLATYWVKNQYFLSPAVRERACRAAADAWIYRHAVTQALEELRTFVPVEDGFAEAQQLATYWRDSLSLVSWDALERARQTAAEIYFGADPAIIETYAMTHGQFADKPVDNLYGGVGADGSLSLEEAYASAMRDFTDAERHLLLDSGDPGSIRLHDGRYLARLYADRYRLLRTPAEIAKYKAAMDFLSLDLKAHEYHDPRRDPDNFYFEDVRGISVNHEGANLYDWRNRRALILRLQEREDGIFFYANNYPPSPDVVEAFVTEKQKHPQKRIIYVVGPSGKALDNVRRLAIKEMLAAGVEVWFMPNQEMHIKMGTGMIGSDNLDKGSLNNSEIIFHTFDQNYIDTITYEHIGPQLQERAIPLHLIDSRYVDAVLGLKGRQMGGFIDFILHQIEYS